MGYANVDAPRGFKLIKSNAGLSVNTVTRAVTAAVNATYPLYVGDPYKLTNGIAERAIDGDTVQGIITGFVLKPVVGQSEGPASQDYLPVATDGEIIGVEDKAAEFEVQIETFALSDIGTTADLAVYAAGSLALKQSRASLVSSGSGSQFTLTGLVDRPADNAIGAYAKVRCRLAQTV